MTRSQLISEHDRLVDEYNATEDGDLLERIAVLEILLFGSEAA